METLSQNTWLALFAIGLGTYFAFSHFLGTKLDPREPPLARTAIPYIGHVIGMMRSKFNYYVELSQKMSLPIFTMPVPGIKMYVVTSPELIHLIQKQPKKLSFAPLEAKFACKTLAISPKGTDIVMTNVNGEEGDWGLSMETYTVMRTTLAPGATLEELTRPTIQNLAKTLNTLMPWGLKKIEVGLSKWVRNTITLATTDSVYGPLNPYQDQEIQDSFWQFEKDFTTILIGVLPSILARKGIAGREKVAKAFQDYFRLKGHEWGSALIKNRYGLNAEKGLSVEDNARFEIGGGIAMLVNTAPPIFWMLVLVYSNPELLDDIRKEVASIMNTSLDENGEVVRNLDISNVKSSCPLLASTYQEILRFRSMGASVRLVMEDILLDGRWLLKKDNLIQMPSRVIHADGSIWGSDVAEFNPRRFLKEEKPKTQNGKRPSPIAFRAFGGGATLCPGRHFATNEILTIVTMIVMRFDMRPVTGDWFLPTTHNTNIVSTMMEPDEDIEVEITLRKGFEEGSWDFGLMHSEKTFALTAEDNAS